MLLSSAKKNYSFKEYQISWDHVKKMLKIKKYEQGNVFDDILSRSDIQQDNLGKLMDNVLPLWEQLAIFMRPFPGNKESKTMLYIFELMQISMPLCSNNLQFDFVKDQELDIVIHADTISKIPVVFIVKAKKNDLDQGRAQLYPQLKDCYELNKKEEDWDHPIFGVISTVKEWIFVRFDGKRWIESPSFIILSQSERNGIQKVIESIYKIIHHQNMLVKHLVDKV
jgi:hypothetical protein